MEGKKQGSSSSSFPAELFGAPKESSPNQHSSTGIFASIFPPPSKACMFFSLEFLKLLFLTFILDSCARIVYMELNISKYKKKGNWKKYEL